MIAHIVDHQRKVLTQVTLDLGNATQSIEDLQQVQAAVTTTMYGALPTIAAYDRIISGFITFTGDVATGSGNVNLENEVTVLTTVLRISELLIAQELPLLDGNRLILLAEDQLP